MEQNKLRAAVADYSRFAFTLLAVSVFFYLGVVIPKDGKGIIQTDIMMGATGLFLIIAFVFFRKAIKYKRILQELEG